MKAEKYYYEHELKGIQAERDGKRIKIERNALNPLPGLTFVSIAYYAVNGEIVGVIF